MSKDVTDVVLIYWEDTNKTQLCSGDYNENLRYCIVSHYRFFFVKDHTGI
jgi:hypothetical protein